MNDQIWVENDRESAFLGRKSGIPAPEDSPIHENNGAIQVEEAQVEPLIVFLAGPIKHWWDGNWETPDHRAYMEHRNRIRRAVVATGWCVAYSPDRAIQGAWHPNLQVLNDDIIRKSDVMVVMTPERIPAEGTEDEVRRAHEWGVQVVRIDTSSDVDLQLLVEALEESYRAKRMRPEQSLVERARMLAQISHKQQVDKGGKPYFEHVERVANRVQALGGDEIARAAAYLHDVIEDTGVTRDDLYRLGMPTAVLETVEMVTKRDGVPYGAYIYRVKQQPRARMIKWADLLDNTSPERMEQLDPATRIRLMQKYGEAMAVLGGPA